MKKPWLSIALGIVTATGGFLDAGTIATAGEAGAKFGLGLIWVILVATIAIVLLVEMIGRFSAVSKKTYAEAIREDFGFRFYLLPLASELIAESLMLTAELGGISIALSLFTGISWHIFFPFVATFIRNGCRVPLSECRNLWFNYQSLSDLLLLSRSQRRTLVRRIFDVESSYSHCRYGIREHGFYCTCSVGSHRVATT